MFFLFFVTISYEIELDVLDACKSALNSIT